MNLDLLLPLLPLFLAIAGLIFHAGMLSQRVKHLEKETFSEQSRRDRNDDHDRLVVVETSVQSIAHDVGDIKTSMLGVQKQLANIRMGKAGAFEVIEG